MTLSPNSPSSIPALVGPRALRALTLSLVLGLVAWTGVACQVVIDDECNLYENRDATVDAAGASELQIVVGAGSLEVRGDDAATEVTITGEACASSQQVLDAIELVAERRGDRVHVESDLPSNGTARLSLTMTVPAGMAVDIEDGSGSAEVRGVRSLTLDDGSGSIKVADVAGDVRIDDGSGSIEVLGVTGATRIADGSGSMTVTGIGGEVWVEDGSGSITIQRVDSNVEIASDGSGSMSIEGVGGSVRVRDDGSGSITVRDVVGDLIVDSDGSGGISYDDIQGRVEVPEDN